MPSYSVQERVKIVEFYYASGESIVTTQKKYRQHFNTATAPSVKMIRSLITRFEDRGSVVDEPRTNVGRPVRTNTAVSTRQRASQLGSSRTSQWKNESRNSKSKMTKAAPVLIYQFKITLEEYKPKIWRRIQVPENYNFWELHTAIQDAMGWQYCHVHQFHIINPKTGKKVEIGSPDMLGLCGRITGETVKIAKYFLSPKTKAIYEYDFGDTWLHEVILEKILPAVRMQYPQCIGGKLACPPEDCGGVDGYKYTLEIMANPQHEEYEDRMEWLPDGFNPKKFDPKSVKFHSVYRCM